MKNVSLVINVVLAVAVAILYYLHFSSKGGNTASGGSTTNAPAASGEPIVYINTDSLLTNYTFYNDLQKDLAEKTNAAQSEMANRGQVLQKEMNSYQARLQAGMLSPAEEKAGRETLMRKQEELATREQSLSNGLRAVEQEMTARFYDTLVNYLKEYNKNKNYRYILSYAKGGGILLPSEKLDITQDILKGLNEKYKTEKNTTPATTPEKK